MGQLKILQNIEQSVSQITDTTYGDSVSLNGAQTLVAQCNIDVDTPSAKTFDSGVAAFLVVQDLTYTADVRGTAGNSITIEYTGGGTAGAEVVTVVGNAISVQIQDTVSTATEIKTAVDASVAASALISVAVSGVGGNAQTIAAATPLASGANSEVNVSDDEITIPTHGLPTGLKGQLTSTGTLPTGLSTATDYFVIAVDANTIQLASSLANAQEGTPIDITSQGSSGAVNTFTPTSIAGASVVLQVTNFDEGDDVWSDLSTPTSITADAKVLLEKTDPGYRFARLKFTLTAGSISSTNKIITKGLV